MSIALEWYSLPYQCFVNTAHVEMILVVKLRVISPTTSNVVLNLSDLVWKLYQALVWEVSGNTELSSSLFLSSVVFAIEYLGLTMCHTPFSK